MSDGKGHATLISISLYCFDALKTTRKDGLLAALAGMADWILRVAAQANETDIHAEPAVCYDASRPWGSGCISLQGVVGSLGTTSRW